MKLRNLRLWLLASLLTFSLGLIVTLLVRTPAKVERVPAKAERDSRGILTLNIPSDNWEPIFFRQINAVTGFTGQSELRKTILKSGEHEARIWWGFGLSPLEGVILRYVDGQWSAIHMKADNYYEPTKATKTELKPPQSGWESIWKQLVNAGILNLPDASEIDCGGGGLDGLGVVVETQIDYTYRTYMYSNPMLEQCSEAKRVVKITDVIWALGLPQ